MQKEFNLMYNIGKVKYVINFFDGVSFYNDGSKFFNINCFKNKKLFNLRINQLKTLGYVEK